MSVDGIWSKFLAFLNIRFSELHNLRNKSSLTWLFVKSRFGCTTNSDNPLVTGCSFEIKKQGYFDFPTSAYKLL